MALRKGLPAKLAATDANDTRYDFRNFVVCNADGTARSGVTAPNGPVLSSTGTMNVTVAAFSGVAARDGGAVLLASDGPESVLLDAAPAANSRIDVVTARQNDASSTVSTPDANNDPMYIVLKGAASATPVRPIVPDGSLDLGSVLVPSTATATNSAGVVISAPTQLTAAAGGTVPFLTKAALNAWTTASLQQRASVLSDPSFVLNGDYKWSGTGWVHVEWVPTGWTELTLTTNWTNMAGYAKARARINSAGETELQGQVLPRAGYPSSEVFATIPWGGPSVKGEFPVVGNNAATRTVGGVLIDTNGNMNVTQAALGAFSLYGIHFSQT